jgi:hypothetical protein
MHKAGRSSVPVTTGSSVAQPTACAFEQEAGILADFGHFRSIAAANHQIDRASSLGFKGLIVEERGCNDFAVVLRGLTSVSQGRSFQREARSVGLRVRLECRSLPLQGELVAVFGHRRTRSGAHRLGAAAARVGFKGLQVLQDRCNDWAVVLYGLKTGPERRAFARETHREGFKVTFERG